MWSGLLPLRPSLPLPLPLARTRKQFVSPQPPMPQPPPQWRRPFIPDSPVLSGQYVHTQYVHTHIQGERGGRQGGREGGRKRGRGGWGERDRERERIRQLRRIAVHTCTAKRGHSPPRRTLTPGRTRPASRDRTIRPPDQKADHRPASLRLQPRQNGRRRLEPAPSVSQSDRICTGVVICLERAAAASHRGWLPWSSARA